jgi:hypothetical protein
MIFRTITAAQLRLDDEGDFRRIALFRDLRRIMVDEKVPFRVPSKKAVLPWNRALFLNLTFWNAVAPSDVLTEARIPSDVLCHAAWHHLARCHLSDGTAMSAEGMFLGEAIASAFDLYLLGRLLPDVPEADFLTTQVPAMTDAALDAGLSEPEMEALLTSVSDDPDLAFEELRVLLFDVCTSLVAAHDVDDAAARLAPFATHRFHPILHHYEVSNWILFARAHAAHALGPDPRVRAVDAALRAAPSSIAWLDAHWVQPRLARGTDA